MKQTSLKSRLEVFTVLVVLITVGIFGAVFMANQYQSQQQLKTSLSEKQKVVTQLMVGEAVAEMERSIFSFTRDEKLLSAIKAGDLKGIAAKANTVANLLEATGVISNLRILDGNNQILFTRKESESGIYPLKLAEQAKNQMMLKNGIEKVGNAIPEIHFVFPIAPKGQLIAVIDLALSLDSIIGNEARVSGNELFLFDTQKSLITGSKDELADPLSGLGLDVSEFLLTDLDFQKIVYHVVSQPLSDFEGKPIAYLVSLTDGTELKNAEKTAFNIGMLLVIVWLLMAYFAIKFLLDKAFKPLDEMLGMVETIQKTGQLNNRITVATNDEIGRAACANNNLIGMVENALNEVNQVMQAVAGGDFTKRIQGQYVGAFEDLKTSTNKSISSVDHTMRELNSVVRALEAGDLTVRMNEKVPGEIRLSVDKTMTSMQEVMEDVNRVLTAMEKGDFTQQVQVKSQGEFGKLSSRINVRVQQTGKALEEISVVIAGLAEGDFTRQVSAQYEGKFGEVVKLLMQSSQNLSNLIAQTRQGVVNLVDNVNQIHHGSQDLNDRTQRQAASLEETTATMQAITQAVAQTSDNARSANQLAASARSQADKGAVIMRSTIDSMSNIKTASHKIEEIISLIDSIAFQTNLLALNAAVEAARAGEHGRGFAVVAGEVRNLAGKSSDAARDIKSLIENAVQAVDEGTQRAEDSDAALQGIIESIRKVGDIVSEITAASNEQSTSINQIGMAISEIDQVTQQNAALVEETSAAAETMRDEADALTGLVSQFKVK